MKVNALIQELIEAFRAHGFHQEAEELEGLLFVLLNGTELEKEDAAKAIATRCHIKWYGDMNLEMPGGGYALWNHLAKIKAALPPPSTSDTQSSVCGK